MRYWRLLQSCTGIQPTLLQCALLAALLLTPAGIGTVSALDWQVVTLDTAGYFGEDTSIALDSRGNPVISYFGGDWDLKCARFDGSLWHIDTVDSAGEVGFYTSLALDGDDRPHISYKSSTDGELRYAMYDAAGWHVTTIDSVDDGASTSLALDVDGRPWISYYSNGDLKLARYNGSVWWIETVDAIGITGHFPSLVLDGAGNPHISYAAGYPENDLRYAAYNGTAWRIETVDSAGNVGVFGSMKLDGGGNPRISYNDFNSPDDHLKYAAFNSSAWQIEAVDSMGESGEGTSLALDAAGTPRIAYFDDTNDDLKYAVKNGSAWDIQIVDAAETVGQDPSLALDGAGIPHISFSGNGDLKFARAGTAPIPTMTAAPTPTPTLTLTPTPTATPTTTGFMPSTPFRVLSVPGTIEAEDYDNGGEGIAYHDTEPANLGGAYRPADGVDIEDNLAADSLVVAYTRPSEWLKYTVTVMHAGIYDVTFRVASPNAGTTFWLGVDGTDLGTAVSVPNTGSWDTYAEVARRVTLPAGKQILRISTSGYHNLDALQFTGPVATPTVTQTPTSSPSPSPSPTVTQTPTPTTPRPTPTPLLEGVVPGRIEAESFDAGGEGVSYHDASPGNSGGAVCRTAEDVDIVPLAGGGYAVAGIEDGEWLAFTIDGVTDASPYVSGPYPVELYVASDRDGRSVQVEVNGTVVRNVTVPNTGSLGIFTPVLTQFGLPTQGRHVIRLLFHGDGQALDKVVFWGRYSSIYADGYAYPRFSANRTNGTVPLTVQFTDQSSRWTYGWHWSFGDGAGSEDRHPAHTFRTAGTFTVRLWVSEEGHWFKVGEGVFGWFNHFWNSQHPYGSEMATMRINVSTPASAIPSSSSPPLDGDGDGGYEDVNGNGRADFADVVLFFNQMAWIAANEPIAAFDYNGNGRIDFADVVWLFDHL